MPKFWSFAASRARLCPISFAPCPFPNLAGTPLLLVRFVILVREGAASSLWQSPSTIGVVFLRCCSECQHPASSASNPIACIHHQGQHASLIHSSRNATNCLRLALQPLAAIDSSTLNKQHSLLHFLILVTYVTCNPLPASGTQWLRENSPPATMQVQYTLKYTAKVPSFSGITFTCNNICIFLSNFCVTWCIKLLAIIITANVNKISTTNVVGGLHNMNTQLNIILFINQIRSSVFEPPTHPSVADNDYRSCHISFLSTAQISLILKEHWFSLLRSSQYATKNLQK